MCCFSWTKRRVKLKVRLKPHIQKKKGQIINISVIIPTYNRYKFLKRALSSVCRQSYSAKEIIVVDDGSTDYTPQIQEEFPNIKYIYQKNGGVSSARNLGIKHSSNEWIAFLDSDDEWDEEKLEKQVAFHINNPQILMSYTDELWIRDAKEVKIPKKFRKFGGEIFEECLSHCIIAPSSVLIHESILEDFDESLEVCEDYDLWLRIASKNEVGLVDEKLITKYAGHDDQLSFKFWGMDRFRVVVLEKLLLYEFPNEARELEKKQQVQLKPHIQRAKGCAALAAPEKQVIVIKNELIKKYTLLLKGAMKYDKIQDIKNYKKRLRELYDTH